MTSRDEALQTIQQLSPTLGLSDLTRVVLKVIRDQVGADRGTIFIVDRKKGEIRSVVADRVVGGISLPIGIGIAGSVAENGQTIDTSNPQYDERFDDKYEPILKYDTKDIFCMAMKNPAGDIVGVLELLNRTRPFDQDDLAFLHRIVDSLGPVLEKTQV